jgi:malonate-semialdehyde dehydrogenase (acetylating)/methylmalonate-semialdehyde dehydrogenase
MTEENGSGSPGPAPAATISQADQVPTVGHWILGTEITDAVRYGDVFDPATGAVERRVAMASTDDVDRAVRVAREAFTTWSQTSLTRRTAILFRFRELLAANAERIAAIVTSEHGKTLDDAAGELQRGLEVVEFACGLAHLLKGEASEQISTGVDSTSYRQPLGVSVGITPFNFPSMVPMWMFPISIACGNAFILKPSERDPSASLVLAQLFAEAGLPDGVFSVVQGDREAVDALLVHPGVDSISFVGSTPIAQHVYSTGTAHGKRVQALGGAKNHAIVMPDADLENAADAIASAAFGSAGQRCMAISAVVAVGDETADLLVRGVVERARDLNVGPGSTSGTDMGPVITPEARARVADYVDRGEKQGAAVALDGRDRFPEDTPGFFIGPTVLDRVQTEMDVYRHEVFGPLLVVLRASSFEDALAIVNDNPYGNGAAIFTNDGGTAREFRARVTAGMVGINIPIPVPTAPFSFGGWKDSLFGDLHAYGREGVLFYTRGKVVTERWPRRRSQLNYGFPSHD